MKTFNTPAINIEKLDIMDVITASGEDCNGYVNDPDNVCPLD